MVGKQENILVELDYDNINLIDPNKVIDEEGNVKFIKKPWDGTWASLFEEENDNAELV